jgi:hypothetical protein
MRTRAVSAAKNRPGDVTFFHHREAQRGLTGSVDGRKLLTGRCSSQAADSGTRQIDLEIAVVGALGE